MEGEVAGPTGHPARRTENAFRTLHESLAPHAPLIRWLFIIFSELSFVISLIIIKEPNYGALFWTRRFFIG